jgi:hypothetical protein
MECRPRFSPSVELSYPPAIFMWACIIIAALLASPVHAAGQCIAYPLTAVSRKIDIRTGSILEALVDFGQTNSVCFGIEVMDDRLSTTGVTWHAAAPFRDLLESALSHAGGYRVEARGRVVSIAPAQTAVPTWLDARVPDFSTTRRADVQSLANLLFMDLRLVENPRLGGFVGDSLGGDPRDRIGPLGEHDRTVRHLLDLIVGSSKGGLWITVGPYNRERALSTQPFWSVLEYSEPLPTNLSRIRTTLREIQSAFGSPQRRHY